MAITITAANSVYMITVIGLFPTPVRLQGYSADAAFETDSVEPVETVLGVDGNMSVGWLPTMTKQTLSIMPDSPSNDFFEAWNQAQKAARETYTANAIITLPSLNKSFVLTKGVLSAYVGIPSARRVMQARTFGLTWNDVSPVPL